MALAINNQKRTRRIANNHPKVDVCSTPGRRSTRAYVHITGWTDKGVAEFKETVNRAEQAASLMKNLGGEMTQTYWTLGQHDLVVVNKFPDDETGTAAALAISSQGQVRTTTLRAFDSDEMQAIISKLG